MKAEESIGNKFGRLLVVSVQKINGRSRFECACDCGATKVIDAQNVKRGISKSCGCENRELASKRLATHGFATGIRNGKRPRVYRTWKSMRQRCENPNDSGYENYGGRGISVCERWKSFESFLEDMGHPPTQKHTLDRKDVNGNYCKLNCQWATYKAQGNNKRNNRILTLDGVSRTMSQWNEFLGLGHGLIKDRLRRGWSVEKALNTPRKVA